MHAFHIDLPDLIIENVGAPFLLCAAQLLAGRRVGIHWLVGVLLTSHDGALHSVNPHSAMYFNPVLDRIFKANVFHQLHHATSRGYYRFVPWAHVLPARRRADCAVQRGSTRTLRSTARCAVRVNTQEFSWRAAMQ